MPQKSVTNWDQKLANWDLTLLGETINFGVVKHGETLMWHGETTWKDCDDARIHQACNPCKHKGPWQNAKIPPKDERLQFQSHLPATHPAPSHPFWLWGVKTLPKIFIDMYRSSPNYGKKCVLDNFFLQQISDFPPFFPPVFRNGRVFFTLWLFNITIAENPHF